MRRFKHPLPFFSILAFVAALGAAIVAPHPARSQQSGTLDPSYLYMFEFDTDPNTIILQMSRNIALLAGEDSAPILKVFGNGDVVVYRPRYLKNSGIYEMKLSMDEIYGLLGSLAQNGVFEFDPKLARSQKRQAELQRAEQARRNRGKYVLHGSDDHDIITLEIFLDRYFPADAHLPVLEKMHKKIEWLGLQWDAMEFPEIESLRKLARAERILEQLATHRNLVRRHND